MEIKEMPLVSVVVPCYNHEKYVKETIESIINQTYKNIELIVIDDGSKDNSVNVIQELADIYEFTFIHRSNKGLSATLNEGISLSNGKYICTCASDDYYALDKIEKQVNFMEKNLEFAVSYTNMIKFYKLGINRYIKSKGYSGFIFKNLFTQKFSIPAGSLIYKKSIFDNVGFFDVTLKIEDFDMLLRIAKTYQIGYLNQYLFYYRAHDNNASSDITKMEKSILQILTKWQNEVNYKEAIRINKLMYFRSYASTNKIEAIKRIPCHFSILINPFFYEGLIRLFIPKFIYRKLR